ncbi:hypothetical protein ACFR9U_09870 [Halorientalis brevis]|uniref:Flagellin n=1 Tax=Halorientalis brevis TaxID=1126241 RepID=A0ABD6CDI0_9EURY|nr:hypothetical protein [Halorientalis brevis]
MSRRDERAVSDVIGFVLVFGLVATTVAIISVSGLGTLQDSRNAEQINNAERAFDVLADNMADVHQEGAPHRATEISLEKAQLNTATVVRMNVTAKNTTSGSWETIRNVQAQPIVWTATRGRETQIAYSFGAVVRSQRDGGVVLNRPPLVLEDDRMFLTIVKTQTNSPKSLSGTTIRVRASEARSAGQIRDDELSHYGQLRINVTTPRADIWQQYLERKEVVTSCAIDEETGTSRVSCALDVPEELYVSVSGITVALEK